jgi:hypothetical protein
MEELNRWMEDCEKEIDREHGTESKREVWAVAYTAVRAC